MSFSRVGNELSRILARLYIMAAEGKTDVTEVNLCSEDENSCDAVAGKAIKRIVHQKHSRRPPPINVPEKVLLCLDVTMDCSNFFLHSDKEIEPLLMLKQSVLIFVNNKLDLNPDTEIGIVILNGICVFQYLRFTNDRKEIIDKLKRIHVTSDADDDGKEVLYCLDELLDLITNDVDIPKTDNFDVPPPFVVRCIFFYGRSKLLAVDPSQLFFKKSAVSPYFFFDSIYLHDSDLDEQVRSNVLRAMAQLDQGHSYILESDNNAITFLNLFSSLAAHPLQRPEQSKWCTEVQVFKKLFTK